MYNYYSTDRIKNLNRERELNQQQLNSGGISNMTSSPSTPIPNGNSSNNNHHPRGNSFNLNSNNRNSGFSSPTKQNHQNHLNNQQQQYQHQQQQAQQQQQFYTTPTVNRKPPKYKISYSVKNTIDNTINTDRHCFGVNSLAFDYNKSILYSAGRDSTIKSYYINSGDEDGEEQEEEEEEEGDIKNYDINDYENKFKFKKSYDDHTDWVNDLFKSQNILVSCSSDSTIKIWNTDNDRCINSLKFHDDYVKVLAYAPMVNYFASSGLDSHIKIWDLNICSMSQSFSIDNNNNNNNSYSSNISSKHITSNVQNHNINNNNNNNSGNNQINTPNGSENTTSETHYSNNSDNEDLKDLDSGGIKQNNSNGNFRNIDNIDEYTPPSSVVFNNHSNSKLNNNNNNNKTVNNNNNNQNNSNSNNNSNDNNNNNNEKRNNKFSPMFSSGSYLVGKSGGEGISIYSLAIAQNASFVVSGSTERAIRGWDVKSGQKIFKLKGHTDNIRSILLNEDSTRCLSASSDGTVRLWDIGQQRCIQVFDDLHTDSVWSLAATDSFSHFFSGGRDGLIFLTDLNTFESKLLYRDTDPILKILNHHDDQSIWVSTTNSTIKNFGLSNFYDKNSGFLSSINENNCNISNNNNNSFIDNNNNSSSIDDNNNNNNNATTTTTTSISSSPLLNSQTTTIIEPKIQIKGRAGIIKNQILNNRIHVLTKDSDENVQMWDITKGREIESFGKVDFEKKLEEFNEVISIPKWFHVDTKTGSLFITLESPLCFQAEAYQSNLNLKPEEDSLINIGESILYSLFSKWQKEHQNLMINGNTSSINGNGLHDSNDSVNSSVSSNSVENNNNNNNNNSNNSNLQKSSSSSSSSSSVVSTPTSTPAGGSGANGIPSLNKQQLDLMIKKTIFNLPLNTDVVISDETSGLVLCRSKIEEFTGREQIETIPWLSDLLTSSTPSLLRRKENNNNSTTKVSFSLESADEKQISQTQQTNLSAHYYIQVRKMCDHIAKELKLIDNNNNNKDGNNIIKAEDFIEICFQNKIMLPHYTLGTVKSFFWKQNSTIPFTYRVKAQFKNEIELRKYLKQQQQQQQQIKK